MNYAYHFDAGERQAFKDRKNCIRRSRPADMSHPDTRAFWDGYQPRTASWAARGTQAPQAWWNERESEIA